MTVYAEIYEDPGGRPHNVEVKALLRNEGGTVIPVASATVSSEDLKKTGNVLRVETQLPLGQLAPGRYVFSPAIFSCIAEYLPVHRIEADHFVPDPDLMGARCDRRLHRQCKRLHAVAVLPAPGRILRRE